ncbi:MAG: tetratricopeptide repeat protein [Anaerolineae bacterium]|nr:tetratricopeptide repeat protein [Anaerolineae bacterium]
MPAGSPKVPVRFDKVQKYFGPVKVLEQFDLEVAPGEFLVLVAELEQLDDAVDQVDRFLFVSLERIVEQGAPSAQIDVVQYPGVITSAEQADAVAAANNAPVIVWGNASAELVEVNLRLNDIAPEDAERAMPESALQEAGNVTLRLSDPRQENVGAEVLTAYAVHAQYTGEAFEVGRALLSVQDLGLEGINIDGVTIAAQVYRYYQLLLDDPETAISVINLALRQSPDNPLFYQMRYTAYLNQGNFAAAREDIETALRLTERRSALSLLALSTVLAVDEGYPQAIAVLDESIAADPDQWLSWGVRGAYHYLNGDLEAAAADIEQAIALEPRGNFPYLVMAILALRQGQIDEVNSALETALTAFSDPELEARLVATLTGAGEDNINAYFTSLFSAFSRLALGQTTAAIADAETAIAIRDDLADVYLTLGVAECITGDFAASEAAYSTALALDPDYTVIYLLRADVRNQQGNLGGALADFSAAQETPAWANFAPLLEDPTQAQLGCGDFF